MATELNIYRVKYTVHRRRLDGKKRQARSDHAWTLGASAEEATRKRLAEVERFDRRSVRWVQERPVVGSSYG